MSDTIDKHIEITIRLTLKEKNNIADDDVFLLHEQLKKFAENIPQTFNVTYDVFNKFSKTITQGIRED